MGQSWDEDGLRLSGPEARPSMPKGPRHKGAYINRGSSSIHIAQRTSSKK